MAGYATFEDASRMHVDPNSEVDALETKCSPSRHPTPSVRCVSPFACCFRNLQAQLFNSTLSSAGGGITNLLFKLQGPKDEAAVLVRIYGEDTDVLIDRERDNALFDELARCDVCM